MPEKACAVVPIFYVLIIQKPGLVLAVDDLILAAAGTNLVQKYGGFGASSLIPVLRAGYGL